MEASDTKRCSRCREVKPIEEFYLRGAHRPGERQSHCKSCTALLIKERRARHRRQHGFGYIELYRLKRPVSYAAACLKTATTLLLKGDLRQARWYADRCGAALQYAKQTGTIT